MVDAPVVLSLLVFSVDVAVVAGVAVITAVGGTSALVTPVVVSSMTFSTVVVGVVVAVACVVVAAISEFVVVGIVVAVVVVIVVVVVVGGWVPTTTYHAIFVDKSCYKYGLFLPLCVLSYFCISNAYCTQMPNVSIEVP